MNDMPDIDPKDFRKLLREIGESADARTVFGEPVVSGDRTIIPVARVRHSGGGGMGGGGGTEGGHVCTPECPPECDEAAEQGYGTGMGLGYMVTAEPVGVIEVTADDVYWVPTLDVNRLAVIGALAGAVIAVAFALGRAFRQ